MERHILSKPVIYKQDRSGLQTSRDSKARISQNYTWMRTIGKKDLKGGKNMECSEKTGR